MADKIIHRRNCKRKLLGQETKVIESYQSGLSLNQVAEIFQVRYWVIYKLLVDFNIPRRSMSESTKLVCTPERNQKIKKSRTGQPSPAKGKTWKLNHRRYSPNTVGENNPNWKGGITPIHAQIRNSPEYKAWRLAVYRRDNWSCVFCGVKCTGAKAKRGEVIIHADHIKPFAEFPELRFDINNGRTLCDKCHRKTPTWGGKTKFQKAVA